MDTKYRGYRKSCEVSAGLIRPLHENRATEYYRVVLSGFKNLMPNVSFPLEVVIVFVKQMTTLPVVGVG